MPTWTCKPEDEIRPRDLLHVLHDRGVAFAFGDVLVEPVRKRMRPGGGESSIRCVRPMRRELAAQADHLFAGVADVAADVGPELRRPIDASRA